MESQIHPTLVKICQHGGTGGPKLAFTGDYVKHLPTEPGEAVPIVAFMHNTLSAPNTVGTCAYGALVNQSQIDAENIYRINGSATDFGTFGVKFWTFSGVTSNNSGGFGAIDVNITTINPEKDTVSSQSSTAVVVTAVYAVLGTDEILDLTEEQAALLAAETGQEA